MKKDIHSCLQTGYTEPIRDILWGHIYLTPELAALTKSGPFMRLHRIMQCGPAFYVYPGATHTRASHSIGVYHLARRLLISLAEHGAAWLSREGVYSFLCAALLHDLGHFPFTHSLKELPLRSHEELTGKIILSGPIKNLVAKAGGDPELTAAIIDPGIKHEAGELRFYRSLLSGTLDPDKLDYLSRDARCCGVPYGTQDVDFILSCLRPHRERGADILEKGIPSVESVLFSKYLMYRSVYWHRYIRSATAMIKKAVLCALESGSLKPNALYNLDDQSFFGLVKNPAIQSVRDGKFYVPAAEFPYDEESHGTMLDIKNRTKFEKDLASALSAEIGKIQHEKLIIDIPEPISFDARLYIQDEKCWFSGSSTTFKKEMVNALVKSLRTVRIFIDPAYLPDEGKSASMRGRILNITQKWLQLLI